MKWVTVRGNPKGTTKQSPRGWRRALSAIEYSGILVTIQGHTCRKHNAKPKKANNVNLMCTKGLRSTLLLRSVGGNPLSILTFQCGDRNHLSTTDASVRRREPFRIYTGGDAVPSRNARGKEMAKMIPCITGPSYQQEQIKKKRRMKISLVISQHLYFIRLYTYFDKSNTIINISVCFYS